ncbi:MAG: type II toxin-antitoxin system MqsA family antitoxin [bacterium]|nr:type II toxin-antitoxin system MqsA family antitoxin [bacterium]
MTEPQCPLCGAPALIHHEGQYKMYPPPNIPGGPFTVANAKWEACAACNEEILPAALLAELEAQRIERLGYLRPDEIRAVRERAGLTQTEMALFVGVGEKTYCRWEAGRSLQNLSSDNLIRLADRVPEAFAQLSVQRDPQRQAVIDDYLAGLGNQEGCSELALAAHGAELDVTLADALRLRLRILASKGKDQ